jgi:hypothetical protein
LPSPSPPVVSPLIALVSNDKKDDSDDKKQQEVKARPISPFSPHALFSTSKDFPETWNWAEHYKKFCQLCQRRHFMKDMIFERFNFTYRWWCTDCFLLKKGQG